MPGVPHQKQKVLFLLRILCEKTDREHPMSLAELTAELSRVGIVCERKSLYRDLSALTDAGFPVGVVRSKDTRYYCEGMPLDRKDGILLANLIRIAPLLPRKRKHELEQKLHAVVPTVRQKEVFSDLLSVIPEGSVTERVYSNVELLFDAILARVKVRFLYRGSVLGEEFRRRKGPSTQTVSPFRLVWSDGYYLVGADEEGGLAFFRLDRMEELSATSLISADIREVGGDLDFDLNQYVKGYFASLEDSVHMIFRVSPSFLLTAERRFPSDSVVESSVDGSLLLSCDAPADENLLGWLLLHGDEIRLVYPESLVLRLKEHSQTAILSYGVDPEAESGIFFEENGNTVDKPEKMRYNRKRK